jgi:hypothetical protein
MTLWIILIVLIPKFMESVALFDGRGKIGEWTPGQVRR